MKRLAISAFATTLLVALPAAAQTVGQQTPASPCQAEPDQNGNSGNDGSQSDGQKPPSGDLAKTLDPCGGVLKPPPTGDSEATKPPPDEGRTPIIKPGELPPQAPKQD